MKQSLDKQQDTLVDSQVLSEEASNLEAHTPARQEMKTQKGRNKMANNNNKSTKSGVKEYRPKHSERSKSNPEVVKRFTRSTKNDPSWHIADDNLAKAYGSFPYSTISGLELEKFSVPTFTSSSIAVSFETATADNGTATTPGIAIFDVLPTVGRSEDANSAINYTANNLYTFVNKMNSRDQSYEQADLMIEILAILSLYDMYWDARRAYSVYKNFSLTNRYTPKFLVDALGYDYDDFLSSQTDWWGQINTMGLALNQFPLPTVFPNVTRRAYLFSNVFLDRDDMSKAQMYAFRPACYYKFDATGAETGGRLLPRYCATTSSIRETSATSTHYRKAKLKLADLIAQWNDIYNALILDSDIGRIGMDIRKAYGDNSLMYVPSIPETTQCIPFHDEAILMQIMNATIFNGGNFGQAEIGQANAVIKYVPEYHTDNNIGSLVPLSYNRPLFMDWDNPTYVDNIYATRFYCTIGPLGSTDGYDIDVNIQYTGTEILTAGYAYNIYNGGLLGTRLDSTLLINTPTGFLSGLWKWQQFEHAPCLYMGSVTGSPAGDNLAYHDADLYNYFDQYTVPLTNNELKNLHDQSLLAAFGVTKIGSAVIGFGARGSK